MINYTAYSHQSSDNMLGFLRGHSCCLAQLTDDWRRQSLDNKRDVAVISICLSKDFDSICLYLLLVKLKAYGVHDSAIKLRDSVILIYQAAFNE